MNSFLKKLIGILLAVTLVIGFGFYASDARLKATDEEVLPEVPAEPAPAAEPEPASEPVEVVVEENEEYVLTEVIPGEEETPAEEEAPAEEESADEEEVFDVAAAYRHYITLSDSEKQVYLNSLSAENRAALLSYIEMMEKKEAGEEKPAEEEEIIDTSKMKMRVWDNRSEQMAVGQKVTLFSELEGFDGIDFSYRWQCNKGGGWEDVPGGNGSTYTFSASVESLSWSWRLLIDF